VKDALLYTCILLCTAKPHVDRSIAFFSLGPAGVEKRSRRQVVRELFEVCEQRTDVDEHVSETRTQENLNTHLVIYDDIIS